MAIVLVVLFTGWIFGDESGSLGSGEHPYRLPRADAPIQVDGLLDEPAWKDALRIELSYETTPGYNTPASVRTEALLTYDREAFYVGFRAYDPDPTQIQADLADHDCISGDDQIGIEIDTFNDERRCYNFFINPLAVKEDSVAVNNDFDFSWDSIWDVKTYLHPWGYSAEIAVPYSSIRFQRQDGPQVWGFNAERARVRDEQYWVGAVPLDRSNGCRWCQLLKIEGFEGVKPGKNLELIPAVTMTDTASRSDFPSGDLERRGADVAGALTAHWGMTPSLTVSGTLNPDFSHVEADALQLDINEPFALLYEEKRPFFSEGADFFRTPMRIVHTRTMRDPVWGLKRGGKEQANTLGAYVVEDEVTNLVFPASRSSKGTSLDPSNVAAILRYAKDLGNGSAVGGLITAREGTDYFNRMAGFDLLFRVSEADTVIAQAVRSSTRYPERVAEELDQPVGTFKDTALSLGYEHLTRSVNWRANYEQSGGEFRANLGFVPQVGFHQAEAGFSYERWAPTGRWWSRLEVGLDVESGADKEGVTLRRDAGVWLRYQGTLPSSLHVGAWRGIEGFAGREFDFLDIVVDGAVRPVNDLTFVLHSQVGDQIDYRNARSGKRCRLDPRVVWYANRQLSVDLKSTFEWTNVGGRRYYTAAIGRAKLTCHFSNRSFARAVLQVVDYDYRRDGSAGIDVPEDPQSFFVQLLYSYKLNPRSMLLAGYSESSFGGPGYVLTKANRTLYVKMSYSLCP